ncbi:MAG: deoxyhypusine synthase [Candidatus Dadabacteria bacterium]|nr:deoxyhypusine synthase [Candidatus Dadabacteria bacterium]NIQ14087.1 deoxyhypusine synthase [Candidatus Dadabacteria bacterium]
MSTEKFYKSKVRAIDVKSGKSISELLQEMGNTGFQGKNLAKAVQVYKNMIEDKNVTIFLGYAGSLSTTGQWKIINWLIENNYIDVLIPTGANISEDIVEAMGFSYWQGKSTADDNELFKEGINRYYDVYGKESDYLEMTELLAEFILTLDDSRNYTSREFLFECGKWLGNKNINSIVATAARMNVPIFCPAIADSPYGDAALIARSKGFNLTIDAIGDYVEFMQMGEKVTDTGVIYIGGGVPKDFIQLFAVTSDLLYKDRVVPNRQGGFNRKGTGDSETYYPHKYAIQITTDSPQWGGLSGCTFDEAVSWGKETPEGQFIQCYCDATIGLPLISHALSEGIASSRKKPDLGY